MRTLRLSWLFALAGALVIPACSDSKSSLSPTAPSAISSDNANAEVGAIDAGEYDTTGSGHGSGHGGGNGNSGSGNGNGNGNGNSGGGNGGGNGNSGGGNGNGNSGGGNGGGGGGGNSGPGNGGGGGNSGPGNGGGGNSGPGNGGGGGGGNSGPGNGTTPPTNTSPNPTAPVPPAQSKVEIEGLVTAVGAASITVNSQTALVTSDTVIRHGDRRFTLSDVRVGDRVHVKATRVTSTGPGATTTLTANEIKLQNRDDDDDDDDEDDDEDEDEDDEAVVFVNASDALASETGPNSGTFRLQRDASGPDRELLPLTVSFTLNGTATNGTDYISVPLTATFAAGQDRVDVVITPIADTLTEGSETVVLTLTNVAPFRLGSPATAVIILSDTQPATPATPIVTVAASDPTASEAGEQGVFRFFRTGPTTLPLTVTVMIAGTATSGTDYTPLLTTVSFLAGANIADVAVSPLTDIVTDPLETVIVTLVDGPDYDLGAALTQTATIVITGS